MDQVHVLTHESYSCIKSHQSSVLIVSICGDKNNQKSDLTSALLAISAARVSACPRYFE